MTSSPGRTTWSGWNKCSPKRWHPDAIVTAVVVLNWNLADMTLRCVASLIDDGITPQEIVVVDNGSKPGEADRLRNELPAGVHVLSLPENIGYARASNAGAAERPS